MPITPEFAADVETIVSAAIEDEYTPLTRDLWWDRVATTKQIATKRALIMWLLSTASIERPQASNAGGQARFEDMVTMFTEFETQRASSGLKIDEEQAEDILNGVPGGAALDIADQWARGVAKMAAYWPQEELGRAILANPVGYDGLTFFHTAHPVNPYDDAKGTYANHFTGAAAGAFPGALPLDGDTATARENLGKAIAYIGDIKMPNGRPRRLKVGSLLVPPTMGVKATEITQAKFIAKNNGTQDHEAVISYLDLGQPIIVPELSLAQGGSDTDCYLAVRDVTQAEIGAFLWVERKPFEMNFHSGRTAAELAVSDEIQYLFKGRNAVAPGHPYKFYKLSKT